jgi:penicillin-binding protein 1A
MAPDGAVRAIIGGRNYADSQFNRATDAERQPGSAFKPFVYLAALLDGFTPDQIMVDGPVSVGNWSPKNYSGKYAGPTTLTNALAHSFNSIPVKLMQVIGRKAIIKTAHDVGIQGELETWPPMVLGTSALTLIDLTRGYATFASGGKLATPYAVLEIRRPNGDVIYSRSANASDAPQVVEPEKIAELNSMLSAVVKAGTARKADLGYTPQGGKTGTNQGYRDAWFVGFTAHNVTGVWVGNDDFTPMNEVTGGLIPAPTWKRIMDVAEAGLKPQSLAGVPLDGTYVRVASAALDVPPEVNPLDPTPDETGIATSEPADSNAVLNNMFSLFEKNPRPVRQAQTQAQTQPRPKRTNIAQPPKRKVAQLVLPKANIKRTTQKSFLDNLFGVSDKSRKRRKRRPLFGF